MDAAAVAQKRCVGDCELLQSLDAATTQRVVCALGERDHGGEQRRCQSTGSR